MKYREATGGNARGLVPLLEYDDNLVVESDVIAKYVAENIAKTDVMYPPSSCEKIDGFLELWYPVTDSYYDLLRATSIKAAQRCETEFLRSLGCIENELDAADGDFLLGGVFSLAECISAPWIQRCFVTLPYFRGIDVVERMTLKRLPRTVKWMKAVCKRSSVVESKCPEDEMLAAARRYYVSFVTPGAPGHL